MLQRASNIVKPKCVCVCEEYQNTSCPAAWRQNLEQVIREGIRRNATCSIFAEPALAVKQEMFCLFAGKLHNAMGRADRRTAICNLYATYNHAQEYITSARLCGRIMYATRKLPI